MFTGLVEAMGEVVSESLAGQELALVVRAPFEGVLVGESIAVSGTCLTVDTAPKNGTFSAFASKETLERTTIGALRTGARVNLERALLPTTRMGGHIVTGHVDGVGKVRRVTPIASAIEIQVELDRSLAPFVAAKGSIAVDGVSLTVNRVEADSFTVLVIPHTREVTTIGALRTGARVNLEVDVLARYAARILETKSDGASWADRLLEKS